MFLPSLDGGGAERAFVELANGFASLGIRVDLVLVQTKGSFLAEVKTGVRVIDLKGGRTLYSILRMSRYIRSQRPDVVMSGLDTANVANWIACWLAGVAQTAVLTQRSVLTASWRQIHPLTAWLWIRLLGLVYRRARLVIGNSGGATADLRDNLDVNQDRLAVIHNSVDVSAITKLASEPLDHPWVSAGAPPIVLIAGSLTIRKDVPTTLRAFAHLRRSRNCNLVVVGEGAERPNLERLVRELGIQDSVFLAGFDRNAFRWMARARVLVNSSPSEGCPNVILQALACGLQVVATNGLGGTSEILEGGRWGRLTPVGDDQALAHAICQALDNPLPEDGRKRATNFDPDATAKAYLRLLLPSWQGSAGEGS